MTNVSVANDRPSPVDAQIIDPFTELDIEVPRGGELALEEMDIPPLPEVDLEVVRRVAKELAHLLGDADHVREVARELGGSESPTRSSTD